MSNDSSEKPKLIIDEDWKTQVQREKEELKRERESKSSAPASGEGSDSNDADSEQKSAAAAGSSPPPPASLILLVTSLATQAMAAMGLMPGDDGKPLPTNLPFARHFIDSLAVIEEKTKGNLTSDEQSYLKDTLHQLRMAYITVSKP